MLRSFIVGRIIYYLTVLLKYRQTEKGRNSWVGDKKTKFVGFQKLENISFLPIIIGSDCNNVKDLDDLESHLKVKREEENTKNSNPY